ncbi:hypothetical protein [Pseudomonas putida]|uniref:Uncharacterized protein n=1 Tax=Pseudomonas putida TaxID=303 RepID=A0A8I1EA41_PSEPU|nr:hypothetical protein [Pseudomonas putida]MBI6882630.1 hypothetical protein [Pseudomonas putida]
MNVQKTYDKGDNDTYVEKLGKTPYQDVHLHMFRDEENGFVQVAGVRGNFTADSIREAENHVLHFPTSIDTGLVKVRDIKAITLYPMSLVERYELSADDLCYTQRVPVYFDPKEEEYVLFMDARFLRDLNWIELRQYLDKDSFYQRINAHVSTRGAKTYLGISFKEISDIKLASDNFQDVTFKSPLRALHDAYVKYKRSSELREKIIVVRYANLSQSSSLFELATPGAVELKAKAEPFQLEYSIGYRVGDRFHLADEQGEICQDLVLEIDRESNELLVIPYSLEQMQILKNVEKALNEFRLRVVDYLIQSKAPENVLDSPLIDDEVLQDLLASKS